MKDSNLNSRDGLKIEDGWHAFGMENEIPNDTLNGKTMTVCYLDAMGEQAFCEAIYRNNFSGGRYFVVAKSPDEEVRLRNVIAWREI